MKRKIIAGALIAGLFMVFIWIYNSFFAYTVYYNAGNNNYGKSFYENAIANYDKALSKRMSEGKECSIRINMALSYVALLKQEYDAPENIQDSIMCLENARDVLLAQNCATEDGNGHNTDAETLRKEIDDVLQKLYKKNGQNAIEEENKPKDDKEDPKQMDEKEQAVHDEIKKMQEKAIKDRSDYQTLWEEVDYETTFGYDGDIW